MEDKRIRKDRFKRVAVARTNKILRLVDLLGNCSNQNLYEYSDDEVRKIFIEIEKRLKKAKSRFEFEKTEEFSL